MKESRYPNLPVPGSIVLPLEPACGEAFSSMLQRLAAKHGVSYAALMKRMQTQADADFMWPWSIRSTARFLELNEEAVAGMLAWRNSVVGRHRAWIRGSPMVPAFGVCWDCCQDAGFVHYKSASRFSFITHCLLHNLQLVRPSDFPLDSRTARLGARPVNSPGCGARWIWEKRMYERASATLQVTEKRRALTQLSSSGDQVGP